MTHADHGPRRHEATKPAGGEVVAVHAGQEVGKPWDDVQEYLSLRQGSRLVAVIESVDQQGSKDGHGDRFSGRSTLDQD